MARKAILHIGPMKTGSTSIQWWSELNRDYLLARGIFAPNAFDSNNMSRLAWMADAVREERPLEGEDARKFRALEAQVAALPAGVSTVLMSGEMMGERLRGPERVAALKRLLDPLFDEYLIITYLRRQDEKALSHRSTLLRQGEDHSKLPQPFPYDAMLKAWTGVFGRQAVVARIFERASLPGGDVVRDFAERIGVPYEGSDTRRSEENQSLKPEAQAFLERLTAAVRERAPKMPLREHPAHRALIQMINRRHSGPGQRPTRAEMVEYYDRVRASNERVRAEWFPERPSLFSDDFSKYPETPMPEPPADAVLGVALDALVAIFLTGRQGKAGPGGAGGPAAADQGGGG